MNKILTVLMLLLIVPTVITSCANRSDVGAASAYSDIYEAIEAGNLTAVENFVSNEPGIVNTKQKKPVRVGILTLQCSPLAYAILNEKPEIASFLIKKGARINEIQEGYLRTGGNQSRMFDLAPLHLAALTGRKDMVQVLVDNGADVNVKNTGGETPLYFANKKDVATYLIDKGADVNAKARYGATPLHIAAATGNKEIVEILIARGANVNAAENRYSWTPLHAASMAGFSSVVTLLVSHGAKVNTKDKLGKTALDYANSDECKEISNQIQSQRMGISTSCQVTADYLKKHGAK